MYIILFLFVITFVVCATLCFKFSEKVWSVVPFTFSFFLIPISILWIILIVESHNKADFYNAVYGSKLTAEEVFWNDDFIKSNIIGERKNYNLNMRHEGE